jgi:hypothetical protein
MSDILTLTGAPKTIEHKAPTLRLVRDEMQVEAEQLAPLSDCLFRLGGEASRLLSMLGGDVGEARRLIDAEIDVRFETMEARFGND